MPKVYALNEDVFEKMLEPNKKACSLKIIVVFKNIVFLSEMKIKEIREFF